MNWLFELHKTQPAAHAIGIVQKKAIRHEEVIHKPSATQPDPRVQLAFERTFLALVGLILANWQERRPLKALRERCPELPPSISGVMEC
jgi:hypothetical protein